MISIQLSIDELSLTTATVTKTNCNGSEKVVKQQLSKHNYATFEPDFFKLDGSYDVYGDDLLCIISSNELSDSDCKFINNPVITIAFDKSKNLKNGLNIDNDGIVDAEIKYYTKAYKNPLFITSLDVPETLIKTVNITGNTQKNIHIPDQVINVGKIIITVTKVSHANRHSKIYNIDIGGTIEFTDKDIDTAEMVEETDLFAEDLPNDELTFDVICKTDFYNFANPDSIYDMLEKGLKVLFYKDNQLKGIFYLEEWQEIDFQHYHFRCVDILGKIKDKVYYGSEFNWPAGTGNEYNNVFNLIQDILSKYFTCAVCYDGEYEQNNYIGYIGKVNIGTAILYISQLLGQFFKIVKSSTEAEFRKPFVKSSTIKKYDYKDMFGNPDITLCKYITGYDIQYYSIGTMGTDIKTVSKQYKMNNTNAEHCTVFFDYGITDGLRVSNSVSTVKCSNNDILSSQCNIQKINSVDIDFDPGTHGGETVTVTAESVTAEVITQSFKKEGTNGKTVSIYDNTLIGNQDCAKYTADWMINYSKNRLDCKFVIRYDSEINIGQYIAITDRFGNEIQGTVYKIVTDITQGCIQTVFMRGRFATEIQAEEARKQDVQNRLLANRLLQFNGLQQSDSTDTGDGNETQQ